MRDFIRSIFRGLYLLYESVQSLFYLIYYLCHIIKIYYLVHFLMIVSTEIIRTLKIHFNEVLSFRFLVRSYRFGLRTRMRCEGEGFGRECKQGGKSFIVKMRKFMVPGFEY